MVSTDKDVDAIRLVPETATRLVLSINKGQPIKTRAHKTVPGGAEMDDVGIVGPGLLFAAGMYLCAVGELAAQVARDEKNRDWHAAPLLRTLYEYVVTFCWVMADDTGSNAKRWAAEDQRIRLAAAKEIERVGAGRRVRDTVLARFRAAVAAAKPFPSVEERAREADGHWANAIPKFRKHPSSTNPGPLTDFYPLIYRNCSSIGHPTPRALQACFVHGGQGEFVIGTTEGSSSQFFYTQAPIIFSLALLVGTQFYSWVDGKCVDDAFTSWADARG